VGEMKLNLADETPDSDTADIGRYYPVQALSGGAFWTDLMRTPRSAGTRSEAQIAGGFLRIEEVFRPKAEDCRQECL
jgi:hypothetical protein